MVKQEEQTGRRGFDRYTLLRLVIALAVAIATIAVVEAVGFKSVAGFVGGVAGMAMWLWGPKWSGHTNR